MKAPFDPWTATADEAVAATDFDSDVGPDAPIYQSQAAQEVMRFAPPAKPNGFDVLHCVAWCAMRGLVMPDWLARAYLARYRAVQQLRADSWDAPQAFGRPYPKGSQIAAMRKRRLNRLRVADEVSRFVSMHPDLPLDPEWHRIGASIGEGRTRVQELLAEAVKMGLTQSPTDRRQSMGWPRVPTKSRKLAGRPAKR